MSDSSHAPDQETNSDPRDQQTEVVPADALPTVEQALPDASPTAPAPPPSAETPPAAEPDPTPETPPERPVMGGGFRPRT